MNLKEKQNTIRIILKNILYIIIVIVGTHIIYGLLPLKFRETFSGWIFTGVVFPMLINCFMKKRFAKSVYVTEIDNKKKEMDIYNDSFLLK